MKVISRREQESLVIGDDIVVTVLEVGAAHVRLGIRARNHSPAYWEETLAWQPVDGSIELELSSLLS